MVARGVAEMMSRISKDEEDEASLWRKKKIHRWRSVPGGGSSEIMELSRRR
jgi:hypothetical protein